MAIFRSHQVSIMPPYDPSLLDTIPSLEPMRLVLVPLKCFYCGYDIEYEVDEYRICHLFGLFHCDRHLVAARRDCEEFMRREGIVRIHDARSHPVLGPFITALSDKIPVMRSSGAVDTDWHFPHIDEVPLIKYSKTKCEWGFNLTNGSVDKFVPLSQFHNSCVGTHLTEEARGLLEAVENTLIAGVY